MKLVHFNEILLTIFLIFKRVLFFKKIFIKEVNVLWKFFYECLVNFCFKKKVIFRRFSRAKLFIKNQFYVSGNNEYLSIFKKLIKTPSI